MCSPLWVWRGAFQPGRRHAANSGCGLETDQRGCIVSFGNGGVPPNKKPTPIKGEPPSAPSYKHGLATWTNSMKSNPHVHSTCQPPNKLPASGSPAHRRRHWHWPGLSPDFSLFPGNFKPACGAPGTVFCGISKDTTWPRKEAHARVFLENISPGPSWGIFHELPRKPDRKTRPGGIQKFRKKKPRPIQEHTPELPIRSCSRPTWHQKWD